MTDKQIIINGVNVAECRYFISKWDFNNCGHICKGTECKYKRLWYKKQLKLKEQECEELRNRSDEWMSKCEQETKLREFVNEQLDQLKAENEKLKKQVCGLRPELKGLIDDTCCKYNIEVKTYHEKIVEIIYHLNMYDQTLADIKNIAERETDSKEFMAIQCMLNGSVDDKNKVLKQILQKISEVEDDR